MNASQEFAKLWKPGIAGVELFSAQLFHHAFAKHMHDEYTIGMNDGGQGCFLYRGETHRAYQGHFNLINPGEIHTGQAEANSGWAFRNLYITVPLMQQVLTQLEWKGQGLPYFSQPVVWDEPLRASFCKLFNALNEPTSQLAQHSLLLDLFSQLLLKHAQSRCSLRSALPSLKESPPLETKAIALVRSYLETHYAEDVSIDALSQLVGLSPYYLIRTFHQQVGLPPHSYQRHLQLVQAKRSLQTPKPLSEVAIEAGFYDQSHLSRHFKKAFGITPGQYQAQYL